MDTSPPTGVSVAETVSYPWSSGRIGSVAGSPEMRGAGSVSGVVRLAGIGVSRAVEIYDQQTMTLARALTSASDGTWSASGLTTSRPLRVIYRGNPGERDVTIQGVYAT